MPLLPDDENWLLRGRARPDRDIVSAANRMYDKAGLEGCSEEIENINRLPERELRLAGAETVRGADVAARGTGSRLMVYSLAKKSRRCGRPSV